MDKKFSMHMKYMHAGLLLTNLVLTIYVIQSHFEGSATISLLLLLADAYILAHTYYTLKNHECAYVIRKEQLTNITVILGIVLVMVAVALFFHYGVNTILNILALCINVVIALLYPSPSSYEKMDGLHK